MSDVCLWHLIINWKLREVITRFWNYIRLFSLSLSIMAHALCSMCCCNIFLDALLCQIALFCSLNPHFRPLSLSSYTLDCFDNKLENKLILSFNAWNPTGNLIGFIFKKEKQEKATSNWCIWKTGKVCTNFGGYKRSLCPFTPLKMKCEKLATNRKKVAQHGITTSNENKRLMNFPFKVFRWKTLPIYFFDENRNKKHHHWQQQRQQQAWIHRNEEIGICCVNRSKISLTFYRHDEI